MRELIGYYIENNKMYKTYSDGSRDLVNEDGTETTDRLPYKGDDT